MDVESVIEIVKKFVGVHNLISWVGEKLIEEYRVTDIEVKRIKDAVVLVIKAQDEASLVKIEEELRNAVSSLGIGEKIEVEVEER